jgi:hypothetical protein
MTCASFHLFVLEFSAGSEVMGEAALRLRHIMRVQ